MTADHHTRPLAATYSKEEEEEEVIQYSSSSPPGQNQD
jgi:hypothetical protein